MAVDRGDKISWNSPIFGRLGPIEVMEVREGAVLVRHPVTGEEVEIWKDLIIEVEEEQTRQEFRLF